MKDNMLTAYVDESGFTGRDLLSTDQPFMSLAGIFVSQKDAAAIRARHFPRSRASELKHKSLSKRPAYYGPLLAVQRECLTNHKGVAYVVNKKYMCILKMLDDCIEPVWYKKGFDFYQRGAHLALASLIYATANTFWGDGSLDRLLRLFQEAIHAKTPEKIKELSAFVRELQGRKVAEYLAPIASMHPVFVESISSPLTSTNIAFSLLSGLVTRLEKFAQGPYIVVHDRSETMRQYHGVLKEICSDETTTKYRISDICHISYPLKMHDVKDGESKDHFGLQLADILAGGVISCARALAGIDNKNDYNIKILAQYSDDNIIFMLPSTDFEETIRRFNDNDISASIDEISRKISIDKK